MDYTILQAILEHVPFLPAIEDAAGELFSVEDIPEPARSIGIAREQFEAAVNRQRVWVAVPEGHELPIAFLLADVLEGCWHVQELDVHPGHARRGIGSRLLDHALAVAASRGFEAATLTTFEHLPWNAPFYARRGFQALRDDELSEGLARVLDRERALGMKRRIAMMKRLRQAPTADG